ncbi:class I SAM-dependent methyltransferase [Sesbania bispinosa]|nr:class I SAM-dependent methyltransferase [Sesbania bispinosa]
MAELWAIYTALYMAKHLSFNNINQILDKTSKPYSIVVPKKIPTSSNIFR